ncbi:EAL domain-containing protein [Duganella sp. FT135W]|uniref:EAL domain-containing protein n=1 Tax=Duganella flavida TaxID=2692175 RepID=A0A6L8K3W5_9BURK|nr:EAL domain-containing protein [Duganella flavida]MYM22203.1 EAL domain-containing protein [Duganella flavida]
MTDLVTTDTVRAPAPSGEFFLARQPILGRDQRLMGFELLFRSADIGQAGISDDVSATAAVIAHVSQLGMEQVVGHQLAFVNVDATVLASDFVRFLPSDKVVLEILETVKATPEVILRVTELKQFGFKFALDDVIVDSEDVRKLLPLVHVVKIDLKGVAPNALPVLLGQLNKAGKKLLAEKVETREEFQQCLSLGFDYFQGYYFARPVVLSGRKISPSELAILRILDQINTDVENSVIELSVKHDPLISLNLLRLVNTPTAGAHIKIDSIGKALLVLGRRQLQRWLQILLYAKPGETIELSSPLLQMATVRGKLLELMLLNTRTERRTDADTGFTVGMLSLIDTLFSMSMSDVLDTLVVSDDVRAALLMRSGDLGRLLDIVEMLEQAQLGTAMHSHLRYLKMSPADLHRLQLQAFQWSNGLTL